MLELLEEPERAEFYDPQFSAVQEMEDDGDCRRGETEKDKRVEKGHSERVEAWWRKNGRKAT
jgi:hypothetical protein